MRSAAGTGAEPGSGQVTCPQCGGGGSVRMARRSLFGTMMTVGTLPDVSRRRVARHRSLPLPAPARGNRGKRCQMTVEVPAGVSTGTRLRLIGRGESGGRSGPPGDLYVEIGSAPTRGSSASTPIWSIRFRSGIAEATLGTRVEVPMIEGGGVRLEIPPGTQPGAVFRWPVWACPSGPAGRGDLHVVVRCACPRRHSATRKRPRFGGGRTSGASGPTARPRPVMQLPHGSPRLWGLGRGLRIVSSNEQTHHLDRVLRLGCGEQATYTDGRGPDRSGSI